MSRRILIKPIEGYDGYFVSTDGKVFSQWVNKGVHGLVKENTLKEIKGSKQSSGHRSVQFGRESKKLLVHRIVYETFVGSIGRGLVIRHLNDIPDDNRLDNLKIGTQKENMKDAMKNGITPRGEQLPQSKLTEKDVLLIRRKTGKMTQKELAEKLGVTRRTVGRVISGGTWRHVKGGNKCITK